ncbi:hypothetical protein [Kutzneria sp. NPDC051319]|uniref:hypothetical protein n=1 Tax=Kutzneria sp. NPDC051319 TaxID=3155047 RepID=UPI0034345841
MQNALFKAYLFDLLTKANDPRISKVERCDADGQPAIRIMDTDGVTVVLSIVNASPPGGSAVEARNIVKEGATPRPVPEVDPEWQHPKVRAVPAVRE